MSFGGFLGIGEHYHPLPWKVLKYDEERGGYVVGINKDALKDAPRFAADDFPVFDARYGAGVYGYWGVPFPRSEEHTSELQSLMRISYAVFCLQKNTNSDNQNPTQIVRTR